jgi:hypothetical protein
MRKILVFVLVCSFIFWNFSFVSAEKTCKEEIIENAYSPVISQDWKCFAYTKKKSNWKSFVIKDWVDWNQYDSISKLRCFNWWKIAYLATNYWTKPTTIIYMDWKEYILNSMPNDLIFSDNWENYAYTEVLESNEAGKRNKKHVVTNTFKSSEFYSIDNIIFSSDSKSFVYSINNTQLLNWKILIEKNIYKDWKIIEWYDNTSLPLFSPDWKEFSFIAEKNGKKLVVRNWVEGNIYWEIKDLKYSSTWESFSYIATKGWKYIVVNNWKEWSPYEEIESLTYSKDWKHIAYVARKNWNTWIVKDWVEIFKYIEWVSSPIFSSDWNSFSYIATKDFGQHLVVKDWIELKKYKTIFQTNSQFPITYFPTWNKLVYKAIQDDLTFVIVIDWVESEKYNYLDYQYTTDWKKYIFSSDWKSFTYEAQKDWNKWYIIKDWVPINVEMYTSLVSYLPGWNNLLYVMPKNLKYYIVKQDCWWDIIAVDDSIKTESKVELVNNDINYKKQLILSKTKLNRSENGKSQIKAIDTLIDKQSKEKLEIIFKNLWTIKSKMNIKTNNKNVDILDYLEASIWIKLWK